MFSSFYGATLPVTGLHWPPYFIEYKEEASNGSLVSMYKGPDGLLLRTTANILNFTYSFLPVSNWVEVSN